MVTIYDIAKQVGCASSTVSRALGGVYGVKEETRRRILEVARELDYVPDETAKNLKTKSSHNIGLITYFEGMSASRHYFFADIYESFTDFVAEEQYDLTILSRKVALSKNLLAHCRSRRLDGVFVLCGDFSSQPIKELLESGIPAVAVDYFTAEEGQVECVMSDNRRKCYDLTEYIISNGHKDIVFVMGQDVYVTNERIKGFKAALQHYGIPFREDMLVRGNYYDVEASARLTKEILARKMRPTVIMMPDDYCAITACDTAAQLGFSVPDDISIAGFDGLDLGQRMFPPLTTVKQRTHEIGKLAAKRLLAIINGNHENVRPINIVEAELIRGGSVKKI